ncbi:hypothetical protein LAZ67_2000677 [Cordylochernes scorpioides]|uniref:Transposase n=1 Tax=Cordylochernes scorpioides TaxID=51811 RepID=A0ABY6K0N2_9ARAC|nr:hypothetical protein LAZ67_2000677 [Cordylochernes scorpioides]
MFFILASFFNGRRDLDTPLHTRVQIAVKAMDRSRKNCVPNTQNWLGKRYFFHDNTKPITVTKYSKLGFQLLPHPSYSPDLVPCDFFLFSNLKKWLGGRKFSSKEEVFNNVNGYFEDLETSYFYKEIKKKQNIAGPGTNRKLTRLKHQPIKTLNSFRVKSGTEFSQLRTWHHRDQLGPGQHRVSTWTDQGTDQGVKLHEIAETTDISLGNTPYFSYKIIDEDVCQKGAVIAYDRPKMHAWNLDTPLHTRVQIAAKAMDRSSRKGDGHCLSRFPRIILIDYLKNEKTITGEHYISNWSLIHLIPQIWSHLTGRSHRKNLPKLEKWLGGRKFSSNEEIFEDVNGCFEDLET